MMKTITMLFVMGMLGLTGCDRGPAEDFGAEVDEAVRDAANAVDDLCEEIRDGVNASNPNC